LVSACYSHAKADPLTPAKLSAALLAVIHEHPALWLVGVNRPSEKKEGNHHLWEARLPYLPLEECVEFIDADLSDDAGSARIFDNSRSGIFSGIDPSWDRRHWAEL